MVGSGVRGEHVRKGRRRKGGWYWIGGCGGCCDVDGGGVEGGVGGVEGGDGGSVGKKIVGCDVVAVVVSVVVAVAESP